MNDLTIDALQSTLHALMVRQKVTAKNIANAEVPNYTAGKVNFEDSLRSALNGGSNPISVQPTTTDSANLAGPDGNNVDIEEEVLTLMETSMRYQLFVEGLQAKLRDMRTSLSRDR